jgi:hypothetical protein
MSHYRSYVISFGHKVKEPCMPDEETYNEQVKCDYCEIEDLTKESLRYEFVHFLEEILPYIPHQIKGVVLKDGTVKVTIPKGCIREFLKKQISEIKEAAEKLTVEDYIHASHDIHHLVDYSNPFTTTFVMIDNGGIEDYDTYRRSLAYSLEDNDKEDTVVYVYGSINHHA